MNIVNMKIRDIRPYKKNTRHNKGTVEAVVKSIKEFGRQQPIVNIAKRFLIAIQRNGDIATCIHPSGTKTPRWNEPPGRG